MEERPPLPPLLRVYWPQQLLKAAPEGGIRLEVQQVSGPYAAELVVTGAKRAAAAAPASAKAAAAPARSCGSDNTCQQLGWAFASAHAAQQHLNADGSSSSVFLLQRASSPRGAVLPIPLRLPAPPLLQPLPRAPPAGRARRAAACQPEQQHQPWQCQVVLYDGSSAPPLLSPPLPAAASSSTAPAVAAARGRPALVARLAPHLLGALLAWLLLAHCHALHAALTSSARLAGFASNQLLWFKTAEPAGIKLHRQSCELMSVAGLHYIAALRRLLAGRGWAVSRGAAGLLAAALVSGGPRRGLLALHALLWVLGLPAAAPYAALAAGLRWQLRGTALMWGVMRGKQQLPLARRRLLHLLRWRRSGDASGGGGGGSGSGRGSAPRPTSIATPSAPTGAAFSGNGIKQLSGSMLLFMPLLLLLPTTGWFYGFALLLHAACCLPRGAAVLAWQLAGGSGDRGVGSGSGSMDDGGGKYPEQQLQRQHRRRRLELQPLLAVVFDPAALPDAAALAAARSTTYLLAQKPRQARSPWLAAGRVVSAAWAACAAFTPPPQEAAWAALLGRPLWLAPPQLWAGSS